MTTSEAIAILEDDVWLEDIERMRVEQRERDLADAYQAGVRDTLQTLQNRAGGTEDWASVADTSGVSANRTKPRKDAYKKR
jgi:hypothetical protein